MRKPRVVKHMGEDWIMCETFDSGNRGIFFCAGPFYNVLNIKDPKEARKVAAWLLKAADWLEGEK